FLRYPDPDYDRPPGFDPEKVAYWMPVDQYMGGVEHAVMHLLYSRFFTRVLRDLGLVDFSEPFKRLFNQGIILGPDGFRMSKSRGNVVNPDDYVRTMGADTVRCYLMFIGPWEGGGPWNPQGINGVHKFLNRVWSLVSEPRTVHAVSPEADTKLRRALHQTIRAVTDDLEKFRFNTMLAKLMTLTNVMQDARGLVSDEAWDETCRDLVLMLAPSAPHLAEELWTNHLGRPYSVHQQPWPTWDEALAAEDELTLPVTLNGKPRGELTVPVSMKDDQEAVKARALELPRIKQLVAGQTIRRVIYVPGKIVNIVAN
ncbi:MAG: class I tRNA ligase family protein, partial [Chloroflexota bacterium]|nr:class I tRNA ligase family protein [Chloroflexota bacterium]